MYKGFKKKNNNKGKREGGRMKFSKKSGAIYIISLIIIFSISLYLNSNLQASTQKQGIENFPASYQPYLKELAKKYPNWTFIALYTNLDWNYVINQENKFGVNLVPKNYSDSWKNTTPGQYNVEVDTGWVDASRQAVEYCMDPRNFLNEVRLFQFETLSYSQNTNNLNSIDKILYGTEFYQTKVSYLDSNGHTINMNETYADLILRGGQTSKVNPYHLASRIKQEVGPFLSHNSISGKVEGYEGLYNFYNIGATSSTDVLGAIKNGLRYARDGKGASQETKNKYIIPWNTKERAITGGAIFIGASYINVGQNTIYLQKFDVNDDRSNNLFQHQYMTNVLAPYSESKSIYNGYKKTGILNSEMTFIIPIFNNMKNIATDSPNINKSNFQEDNTKVYCNATNVNIRTGPGTSYDVITMVSKEAKMTRILKGTNSGERWDKVQLENGIVGYIFQQYVTEAPKAEIESIDIQIDNTTLQKGENKQLQIKILPNEAANQKILFSSSNPNVLTVDDKGNIRAISSGKAVITVKSAGNAVQNQIEITVYSKVTDVSINNSELYMEVDDIFQIYAYVEPTDASQPNIIYKSSNPAVADIDENGIITAHSEGKIIIYAISEENPNIKAQCELTVVRKMGEDEICFDAPIKVNSLEITGIAYNENTVSDIIQKITTDFEIEIVDKNYKVLTEGDTVGTGSKILVKENGNILREYTILIYGDVNGDGKVNSVDLLVLQRHILGIETLEGIFKKAGNIAKDGKKPTSVDLLLIQRHILGLKIIEQ